MARARRKEGLLWECLHPAHVGARLCPRGWFARNGAGEAHRHAHCRECRREGKAKDAARRRGAGVTKIPAGWRRRLWEEQQGCCAICGRYLGYLGPNCHVDHKRAVSRGGRHEYGNLQLTHKRCNLAKSNH